MDFKVFRRLTDRPTVVAVVAFVPPAVQHAHIEDAVHPGFLPAGTAGLQRRARVVEPYVDTLSEEMRRVHLVVFDKRDVAGETIVRGKRIDLMDEMFSMLVRRMCLSSEHHLHWPPLIQHARLDAIQVVENQGRPFIAGKAACESDRERFWIEQRAHGNDLAWINAILRPSLTSAFASESQKFSFQLQMYIPDLFVWNVHNAIPERNVVVTIHPFRA